MGIEIEGVARCWIIVVVLAVVARGKSLEAHLPSARGGYLWKYVSPLTTRVEGRILLDTRVAARRRALDRTALWNLRMSRGEYIRHEWCLVGRQEGIVGVGNMRYGACSEAWQADRMAGMEPVVGVGVDKMGCYYVKHFPADMFLPLAAEMGWAVDTQ